MTVPMFLLTLEARGVECELRLNDVRQYRKQDGAPMHYSARLNPWLVAGANVLTLVARAAAQGGERSIVLRIVRAIQGRPADGAPVLFQFTADPAQLAALNRATATPLLRQAFDVGPLAWTNPWQSLQPTAFGRPEVLSFLQEYLAALQGRQLQALADLNRLRSAVLANSLALDPGAVAGALGQRLAEIDPADWSIVPQEQVTLGAEGDGRFCRVETAAGGPVILARSKGAGSGYAFLLARASGRLWAVG